MRFLLLLLLVFSLNLSAQTSLKYSKARIHINSNEDLKVLINHGVAADHGNIKTNQFIESIFSTVEIDQAKSLGYDVDILIDDAQKYYRENVRDQPYTKNPGPCDGSGVIDYDTPANFNLGSVGGFLTYNQMLSELDDMQNLYPNLITLKSPISSFQTIENRPIYWVKISDNPNTDESSEPQILYDAIHHAREPASMQQLIFYMWYLLENYATNSDIQSLVDNTEMFFVPIINVDGYIKNETTNPNGGGMWRKNMRNNGDGTYGVDLNRNYSYHWGEAGTSGSDGQTYPGTSAFSEPETQAIKWFCEQHNFVMALNAHTYSELLLYPYGYATNTPTPDNDTFAAVSELMVSQNGYNNMIASGLYAASGDSDDWMYGDTSTHNKIYAMTPEIGSSFWPSQSSIIPICKEMVFHNLTGAKLIHNYADLSDTSAFNLSSLSGDFEYRIKRLGLGGQGDFTVSIIPVSANISSVGGANTHNGMVVSEEITSSISYTLDSNISLGETVSYKLVVDNGLFQDEKIIEKIYGNTTAVLYENGNNTTQWDNTSWDTTTSTHYSPPSSITDSPNGDYSNNSNTSIVLTNEIDLSTALTANVSFYAKWNIEDNWDYVQFEVSTDAGNNWEPQCGRFTNAGSSNQEQGEPLYDGEQATWVHEVINLSNYIGSSVLLRFHLVSDSAVTKDGFYFDELTLNTIQNTTGTLDNVLDGFIIYPNPAKDILQVKIPQADKTYLLKIINVAGQVVSSNYISNTNKVVDLRHIPKGIYFVKIYADTTSKTVKIILE